MDENLCRTCRWWAKGLKDSAFGVCRNAELGQYLRGSHSRFSPHESFVCSYYERSAQWAAEAAAEIDDWYGGVYAPLPADTGERIRSLADIILRHMDARGVHAPTSEGAMTAELT